MKRVRCHRINLYYKSRMSKQGSIYKATCSVSGLSYVGQTRNTKTKAGREYAYGVTGRWNDHVTCVSSTPLGTAIQQYGPDAFVVETLESGIAEERLDEREAYWIATLNTCVPNGYNKMRHGRCRHRDESTLSEFYAPTTVSVKLRQIKRGGEPRLIYAYLQQRSGEEIRVVFGQGKDSTYTKAVQDALVFLEAYASVPIEADPRVLNVNASDYETKLARFDNSDVRRIRVAKFNNLAAVYIDKERVCFGGKTIPYEQAVEKAIQFAHALHQKHTDAMLLDSTSKSATGGCPSS
jgi:hypothetical protein